jgi:hypothetical protein
VNQETAYRSGHYSLSEEAIIQWPKINLALVCVYEQIPVAYRFGDDSLSEEAILGEGIARLVSYSVHWTLLNLNKK